MVTANAINSQNPIEVAKGGTGRATLTAHDLVVGAGTSQVVLVAPSSTSGVALISQGASSDPAYGTVLPAGGGTGRTSLTDHNLLVGSGTANVDFIAPSSTSGVPLVSTGASSDPSFGTAVVAGGGTGSTSFNAYGPVVAASSTTGALTSVVPSATSGVPLVSGGSLANPSFGTAVVAGGGTGVTSNTAYAVLCGGTTSTGAFQSIASVGTSGQYLRSNGAGALPTFHTVAPGSSGMILIGSQLISTPTTSVVFTSGITTDHDNYFLLISGVLSAAAIQFSIDGGSSYISSGYRSSIFTGTAADITIVLGSVSPVASSASVYLNNLTSSSTALPNLVSQSAAFISDLGQVGGTNASLCGYYTSSISVNAIKIILTSGSQGRIALYALQQDL